MTIKSKKVDLHHVHCKTLLQLRQNMCIIGICLWYDLGRILLEDSTVWWCVRRQLAWQSPVLRAGDAPPTPTTRAPPCTAVTSVQWKTSKRKPWEERQAGKLQKLA